VTVPAALLWCVVFWLVLAELLVWVIW